MKYFVFFIIWIFSILWWYFSWKYLNVDEIDSLTLMILLAWMFVFWVLFWKIPLLWEQKKQNISSHSKQRSQLNNNSITEIEPITKKEKSTPDINKNMLSTNEFSNFEDIQDSTFLNISHNIKKQKKQDLKIIEWIGPKIEELLNRWWIYSYKDLALSEVSTIQHILEDAWKRYIMHNPKTWPKQAQLAHNWNFEKLQQYQDSLNKWVEK